jgi:predicted TIM-barrel fold metal-dependent hydrolase
LRRLADADLSLDLNGGASIAEHALRLARKATNLRIVIDHLPFDMPADAEARRRAEEAIRGLAAQENVFAKVSHVLRRVDDRVPTDVDFYREKLDLLWRLFGPDRVVYGSNWPVCRRVAPYVDVQQIVMDYVTERGQEATEKYFWKNSLAAYRWVDRS